MADEIRNPMDVPAGQRTPVEYLQQLFGKPMGGPPESTWEENPNAKFLSGPTAGVGPELAPPPMAGNELTEMGRYDRFGGVGPYPATPSAAPSPTVPARSGPSPAFFLPPSASNPDQENMAMLRKLGASGLLPADFWAKHPDLAGGVMKVEQGTPEQIADRKAQGLPDISGKLYSFLEPSNKTSIENNMGNIISMIGERVKQAISSPSGNPLYDAKVLGNLTGQLPGMANAQTATGKAPAEIKNLEAQAAAHTATALEGPAKIKELEARANYYNVRPSEHGQNVGSMITNILTHDMTEASKMDTDPLLDPQQKKILHAAREERTRNAINAVTSLMNKPATAAGPMTATQFRMKAQASGYMPDQIQRELALLIQQGKVING